MKHFIPFALLSLACSCSESETVAPEPPSREVEAEVEAPPLEPVEEPAPEPELPEAREVRISAADGTELVGDLRVGHAPDASLVVLVHQLSTTRAEWEPLLRRLGTSPAFATFAFDMRGHGESVQRRGREIAWGDFETADWEKVAEDIQRVIVHLRDHESLSPRRIVLVGSSIGSSAVILAASRDEVVHAVVGLSPGRAYRGVDAITPLTRFGERPLFVVASRGEAASASTAEDMARIAPGPDALLVDGDRHGVGMFESAPDALAAVVDFIRTEGAR